MVNANGPRANADSQSQNKHINNKTLPLTQSYTLSGSANRNSCR